MKRSFITSAAIIGSLVSIIVTKEISHTPKIAWPDTAELEEIFEYEEPEAAPQQITAIVIAKNYVAPTLPEEEEVIEAPKDSWFSEEYLAKNLAIKEYADQFVDFDFHGTHFDSLAVMAQANTESSYMADTTQTLTALYPSKFVDYNSTDDLEELDVVKVWSNPDSLNGTYVSMPYWEYKAGPYYAWSTGDGYCEQGPLQQRGSFDESMTSEATKLEAAGISTELTSKVYGYEAVNLCTGSDGLEWKTGHDYYGDRWSIEDNCKIWVSTKTDVLNTLWDKYYSTCGYTPSQEEYLAILSYAHWVPEVVMCNCSTETNQYYGFAYNGAWFDLAHQVASPEGLEIIRKHVISNIDKNRSLLYENDAYTKEDVIKLMELSINAGSTVYMSDSEPWQIFDEMVNAGITSYDSIILHPAYGYQHAMKYAIEYLYAYEMLNVLLLEGY